MRFTTILFSSLVGINLFNSCEKVIEVPLEEADRKIVIEGVLRDNVGDNYILLSKTGSVYDNAEFEKISGAVVKVTDQSGTEYVFTEIPGMPGAYNNALFQTGNNNVYNLSVVSGSETFTASSKTFYTPTLDSLNYIEQVGSFGVGTDTTYLVFFSFVDDANGDNFYRINAWVNGVADQNLYVSNDDLFNGQNYTQPLFATTVEKGDTVLVELQSIDKANYDYFFSMTAAQSGGDPFSPTPANPVSNIEGGGLGYFGAYTTDTMTIIIPQ